MAITTPSCPPVPVSLARTPFTAKLERRVLDFVRRNDILNPGERVVVAASGGPDSTALLILLSRLAPELRLDITVAHFNHQLRTEAEAGGDLDFVRSLASSLDLPFAHGSGDVRAYAIERHLSLEDAARRLRYGFLREQASKTRATTVVVGHTLDDQAETVLLHLIRGSGLDGISGMSAWASWRLGGLGPHVVRPLLSFRRHETERYCREVGVKPLRDATNDLPIAARNRIRNEILPAIRGLNPRVEEALARLADAARADASCLNQFGDQTFESLAVLRPRTVSLPRKELRELPRPLAARVVRLSFVHVNGIDRDLEAPHIDALLDALSRPPGRVSLPGGITAVTDSRSLVLRRGEPNPARRLPETRLAVPGCTEIGGRVFETNIVAVPPDARHPTRDEAFLDASKAVAELTVRSRRPGDRLRPLGLGGEKKLQDILVDAKVPAAERDGVPIICGPRGIVWVAGHCIDERYALHAGSQRALHLVVTTDQTEELTN